MQALPLASDDEDGDDGETGSSLVFQTVETLRRRILAVAGDADPFLGTEDQLLESLGVSRPIFRQAARLLQHEQLLRVKRDLYGGCFARAPSPSVVSRLASRIGTAAVTAAQSAIYRTYHQQLALAVRDGDPDRAESLVCRYSAEIRAWVQAAPQ